MANLPSLAAESTLEGVSDELTESIAARIANGEHPKDLARKLAPNDRRKRRRLYSRFRAIALRDARVSSYIVDEARLAMMVGLVPSTAKLARSGRPDAIKLLFEASGFHNPRVQHDHSGEINIKLSMPRPERPAIEGTAEEVVD